MTNEIVSRQRCDYERPISFFRSLPMIAPGPLVASWPKEFLRQPGIEPGSIAWEATMLTITPLT